MDEGEGNVVRDASGNGHDGKVVGASWMPPRSDRAATEWILSSGARAGVGTTARGFFNLDPGDKLPEETFSLVVAGLGEMKDIDPQGLAMFRNLPHMTTLVFNGSPVGDRGLQLIGRLPRLDKIYMGMVGATDAGVALLPERWPNLRILHCGNPGITDAAINSIAQLTKLEELQLADADVTDEGIAQLAKLPKIRNLLILGCPQITQAGIDRLHELLPDCWIKSNFGEFGTRKD